MDDIDQAVDSVLGVASSPDPVEEKRRRSAEYLGWRAANDPVKPDEHAEVLRTAAAAGLPPAQVAKQLDATKRRVEAQSVDWNAIVDDHPQVARFLGDPDRGALARDDVANLTGMEWAFLGRGDKATVDDVPALEGGYYVPQNYVPPAPVAALRDSVLRSIAAGRQALEALGLGSEANRQRIEELKTAAPEKDYGARTWLQRAFLAPFSFAPQVAGDVGSRAAGAGVGAAVGTAIAPGVGTAIGAGVGQWLGSFAFNTSQAVGPMEDRIREVRGASGESIDPDAARTYAWGGAAISGALLATTFGKVSSSIPGVRNFLERIGASTVARALEQKTVPRATLELVSKYGEHVAAGAAVMAGQSAVSELTTQAARADYFGAPIEVERVVDAGAQGFVQGLNDMTLLAAVGPGRDFLANVGRVYTSAHEAGQYRTMVQTAAGSKLLERAPGEFHDLVQAMKGREGAVQTVYSPIAAWDAFWRDRNIDPARAAMDVLQDAGRGYLEAKQTGGDLAMPVEKFLTGMAKSPHALDLTHDVKLSLEGLTPRQAKAEHDRIANMDLAERWGAPEDPRAALAAAEQPPLPGLLEAMTPEERSAHDSAMAEARTSAERELLRRITEDTARDTKDWFREERAQVEEAVHAELDQDPVQRALTFLQHGELRSGAPEHLAGAALLRDAEGKPLKLDRQELADRYSPWLVDQMPKGTVSTKRGAPLDDVALLLGFDSADALVFGLRDATPREDLVAAEVKRRLDLAYPSLRHAPGRLAELALDVAHNDAAARSALLQLRALERQINPAATARDVVRDLEKLKESARRFLADKPIREVSPGYYLQLERNAAKRAADLAGQGKLHDARGAEEQRIFNSILYREALDLKASLDSKYSRLTKSLTESTAARLGKADPVYRDARDVILEAVGVLRADTTGKPGVDALVAKLEQDANAPAFDVDGLRQVVDEKRPWRFLTSAEAENVYDAVLQIHAAANLRNELELEGRKMDRDEVIARITDRAMKLPHQPKTPRDEALATASRVARLYAQWGDAMVLAPESIVSFLDSGETGPFRDAVWNPYLSAKYRKHELEQKYLDRLMRLWDSMPREMKARRFERLDLSHDLPLPPDVANIRDPMGESTRVQLWMIALNMGNDGNKERLLGGYGWSEEQVLHALRRLTKPEAEWIQGVLDSFDTLYPLIAEVHEKDKGIRPGKVQAVPFTVTLADGSEYEFRGGYFPAKYDPKIPKTIGLKQEESAIAAAFTPSYVMPSVAKGHAQARAEHYADVVNLSWSVVPGHVAQVLHDIAFRMYVKQTAGLFLDQRFKTLMVERLGEERAKVFMPWLQTVANAAADSVASNLQTGEKVLAGLRSRVAIQAIGHSLAVFMGDLTNPLVAGAAGLVKWQHLGPALAKAADPAHLMRMRDFMLEHSPEMRYREEAQANSLRKELEQFGGKDARRPGAVGALQWLRDELRDSAFILQVAADKITNAPVWTAAFQQAFVGEGRPYSDAVQHADTVVSRLTPAHDAAEQAPILRDRRGWAALLMFYGYANKMLNMRRLIVHEPWLAWNDPEASLGRRVSTTASAAGKLLALAAVFGAAAELASGRGREDDESWGAWFGRKTLAALLFADLPIVGGLADPVASKAVRGKATKFSVRQAPALAAVQSVTDAFGHAMQSGGTDEKAALDAAELLLGFGVGAPTRQAHKTLGYVGTLMSGAEQPRGPFDVASGLIYGKRPGQPKTPATALEDLAQ